MAHHRKKVFVTGCFDLLHSGHVAFLEEAAQLGDVYMGIGSDETIYGLKGRYPIYTQYERRYMLEALKSVKRCTINDGCGIMDFAENADALSADILFVNEDGSSPEKEEYCRRHGLEYIRSRRVPHEALPVRSTTVLREECSIPFRIDLAGGWLDQPYVSKHFPGPVLTISIEPTIEFNDRSGMASSTRRKAIELWHTRIPTGDREKLAKVLFGYENPPGTDIISGSQDALGIVLPGLNRLEYDNDYWPRAIESVYDETTLRFIENSLSLVMLNPRERSYSVLENTIITMENAERLSFAAARCRRALSCHRCAQLRQPAAIATVHRGAEKIRARPARVTHGISTVGRSGATGSICSRVQSAFGPDNSIPAGDPQVSVPGRGSECPVE